MAVPLPVLSQHALTACGVRDLGERALDVAIGRRGHRALLLRGADTAGAARPKMASAAAAGATGATPAPAPVLAQPQATWPPSPRNSVRTNGRGEVLKGARMGVVNEHAYSRILVPFFYAFGTCSLKTYDLFIAAVATSVV